MVVKRSNFLELLVLTPSFKIKHYIIESDQNAITQATFEILVEHEVAKKIK